MLAEVMPVQDPVEEVLGVTDAEGERAGALQEADDAGMPAENASIEMSVVVPADAFGALSALRPPGAGGAGAGVGAARGWLVPGGGGAGQGNRGVARTGEGVSVPRCSQCRVAGRLLRSDTAGSRLSPLVCHRPCHHLASCCDLEGEEEYGQLGTCKRCLREQWAVSGDGAPLPFAACTVSYYGLGL